MYEKCKMNVLEASSLSNLELAWWCMRIGRKPVGGACSQRENRHSDRRGDWVAQETDTGEGSHLSTRPIRNTDHNLKRRRRRNLGSHGVNTPTSPSSTMGQGRKKKGVPKITTTTRKEREK